MKIFVTFWLFCAALGLIACSQPKITINNVVTPTVIAVTTPKPDPKNLVTATFAGGCFWSMQRMLDEVPGVITTTVGYTGGHVENPTYEQVSLETTGHAESGQVVYDSAQISYAKLLDAYWHDIDPVSVDRQFCDSGSSYRSAIFYHDADQQRLAEASKLALIDSGRFAQPIVTEIVAAGPFYPAEAYHQKFYLKSPTQYAMYRAGCGRDERLAQIWGRGSQ
ncbi:peptide-methionine (S)-S-oxide reductase MsrA [soil metagenome]